MENATDAMINEAMYIRFYLYIPKGRTKLFRRLSNFNLINSWPRFLSFIYDDVL